MGVALKVISAVSEFILTSLLFRKCFDGKLQSESTNVGKNKRDADAQGNPQTQYNPYQTAKRIFHRIRTNTVFKFVVVRSLRHV